MGWYTEGSLLSPNADAILADTTALAIGTVNITVLLACSLPATIMLERRNSTNTANVKEQLLYAPAGPNICQLISVSITVALNERIRIRLVDGIDGAYIQASILT